MKPPVGLLVLAGVVCALPAARPADPPPKPAPPARVEQGAEWADHWAFAPVRRPPVPVLPDPQARAWVRNPIDAFVLTTLRDNGLSPSPEADRVTLIRRVTLDLTGLPPTPEEVD